MAAGGRGSSTLQLVDKVQMGIVMGVMDRSTLYDNVKSVKVVFEGIPEEVELDPIKGPLELQLDGSKKFANCEVLLARSVGRQPCYAAGYRQWQERSATEQEILLNTVAKKNRRMKERGPLKPGDRPVLPDFLAADFNSVGDTRPLPWQDLSSTKRDSLVMNLMNNFGRELKLEVEEAVVQPPPAAQMEEGLRGPAWMQQDWGWMPPFTMNETMTGVVTRATLSANPGAAPLLVCWYSGGFTKQAGEKRLEPFLKAAESFGIKDHLILHHTNEYGFKSEGYADWPTYVSRLEQEINKVGRGRQLILFGHSKGVGPAMSIATRLGSRVLKVYLTSCGSWEPKSPTPWEHLSIGFKKQGDKELLAWLSSLNPGDILLRTVAQSSDADFAELVAASPSLTTMLEIMRLQYKHAILPDMRKKVIDVFSADICAITPELDPASSVEAMKHFRKFTRGRFQSVTFQAGHMDILSNTDCHKMVFNDMLRYFP